MGAGRHVACIWTASAAPTRHHGRPSARSPRSCRSPAPPIGTPTCPAAACLCGQALGRPGAGSALLVAGWVGGLRPCGFRLGSWESPYEYEIMWMGARVAAQGALRLQGVPVLAALALADEDRGAGPHRPWQAAIPDIEARAGKRGTTCLRRVYVYVFNQLRIHPKIERTSMDIGRPYRT